MPGPLRTTYQRAEAKYNVITEFPSLGLHSAAATGNVGLVEYALEHGQPINSVLDGVLPLHAACAGGNVQVVKLLIDHGADVNAPRLPRRYSNERNRDASAPIVGTSGSTPLHFAAANGNKEVVTLLLHHGAHADLSDKHGVTPEILARQSGWLECADELRQWVLNKDKDLRERPGGTAEDAKYGGAQDRSFGRDRMGSSASDGEPSGSLSSRRRIHMKHSIDTALNILKSSDSSSKHHPPSPGRRPTLTPPVSPTRPKGDLALQVTTPPGEAQHATSEMRRPSLTHISGLASLGASRSRKTSVTRDNATATQRPRSAGTGAETPDPAAEQTSPGRIGIKKLGSKYSLMNIFKKAQTEEPSHVSEGSQSTVVPESISTSNLPLVMSLDTTQSSKPTGLSNMSEVTLTPPMEPRHRRGSDTLTRSPPLSQLQPPSAVDLHHALAQQQQQRHLHLQNRDRSRSTSSAQAPAEGHAKTSPSPSSSPLAKLGFFRARDQRRDRSGSASSLGATVAPGYRNGSVFDDDTIILPEEDVETSKLAQKSSILRPSNVTPPSGPHLSRALRFDVNGGHDANDVSQLPRGVHGLRGSSSVGSLTKYKKASVPTWEHAIAKADEDLPDSAPPAVKDFEAAALQDVGERTPARPAEEDEEEEEYGQPLPPRVGHGSGDAKSLSMNLLMRERGLSFASSSDSSLSPILADEGKVEENTLALAKAEFPFSINKPPPDLAEEAELNAPTRELLRVPSPTNNRFRGDSISSTSTTDSQNQPQLSLSGTTSGSGSGGESVVTPFLMSSGRDPFMNLPISIRNIDEVVSEDVQQVHEVSHKDERVIPGGTPERRPRLPPDIDINLISTHAEAKELVRKAQQDILEMIPDDLTPSSGSTGRSPLSARLAAYGQSLALERRLREQKTVEEGQRAKRGHSNTLPQSKTDAPPHSPSKPAMSSRADSMPERQHSLEYKMGRLPSKPKIKEPRRPSTAEGLSPRHASNLLNGELSKSHHSSRSASGLVPSPPSRLSISQEPDSSFTQGEFPPRAQSALPTIQVGLDGGSSYGRSAGRAQARASDFETGHLSRVSSLEDQDIDAELGPTLTRVSTAPLTGSAIGRGKREVKTANKLTRMGFAPSEQASRAVPPTAGLPTPGKKGFGFRSFMQSLKGKS